MLFCIKTSFRIFIKLVFFYTFMTKINDYKIIKIDNLINESLYQNNQDFSNFTTKHKIIAIYYPDNIIINNNRNKYNNDINNFKIIEDQVRLAKSHGIFGFGMVYNLFHTYNLNDTAFNSFLYINGLNFSFFIIFKENNEYSLQNNTLLMQHLTYNKTNLFILFENVQNYLFNNNYIKFREKPIIGVFFSSFRTSSLIDDIKEFRWRKNIFILSFSNNKNNSNIKDNNSINYLIKLHSLNLGLTNELNKNYFYNIYHHNLIKEDINEKKNIKNFDVVIGSKPHKFYIILKDYLNNIVHNKGYYILFNAWNDYYENLYLEPNKEYGFSYLNYFSKAIFDLNDNKIYDLNLLNNKCKIAVQVHLFYEDLIAEIINKTNNIPVKFDLYITITSPNIYRTLDNYIKNYSRSNNYEILLVENKGRDVLPFLVQMKDKIKNYIYICHIHTKKSKTVPETGALWRNYLFNNLLGNINIVSEILNDLESNKKLGFIFPETFVGIIKPFYVLTNKTRNWMNFLSSKLFPNCGIGKLINFPAGNMFWSKINAIFQIFIYDLSIYFPGEDEQTNDTIMHGIERIWLYLVKYNHFKYKVIFNSF